MGMLRQGMNSVRITAATAAAQVAAAVLVLCLFDQLRTKRYLAGPYQDMLPYNMLVI